MDLPRKGSNVRPSLGSHLDESENEVERFSTAPNTPTPPDQDAKAAAVIQVSFWTLKAGMQVETHACPALYSETIEDTELEDSSLATAWIPPTDGLR